MNSLEKKSVFQLVLSTKGKQILEDRLMKETTPISLIIGLGDNGKAASPADTALHNLKIQVQPSLLAPDNELRQGLHINAIFPASSEEFDIKEIGLIIDNSGEKILLGRYANEKVISKMTSQVDLLLDIVVDIGSYNPTSFIINSNDYKPAFSLAKATQHRYGNVRFATKNDVTEKTETLALSTDVLNYPNIIAKTALRDSWSKPEVFKLAGQPNVKSNTIVDFSIIGLSFIPCKNNQVGILLVPKKSIVQNIKNITIFFYSLDGRLNETSYTYDLCIYSHCNAVPIQKINDRIHYLVSVKNEKNKKFSLHTFVSKDLDAKGGNDSKPVLEDLEFSPGSIFYFNNTAYSLGGYDSPNNTIYYGKDSTSQSLTLVNSRKKPLIHLIHDKLYILGGSETSDTNYSSVEIFDPINKLSFAPFTSKIDEINDTENITSCVLENKIYIFFIKQFEKYYKEDKFYYCYDYLGNNWKKRAIAKDVQIDNPEKNLQGKAITIGDEIYLFFTNTLADDTNQFQLSVIKLQPI